MKETTKKIYMKRKIIKTIGIVIIGIILLIPIGLLIIFIINSKIETIVGIILGIIIVGLMWMLDLGPFRYGTIIKEQQKLISKFSEEELNKMRLQAIMNANEINRKK